MKPLINRIPYILAFAAWYFLVLLLFLLVVPCLVLGGLLWRRRKVARGTDAIEGASAVRPTVDN